MDTKSSQWCAGEQEFVAEKISSCWVQTSLKNLGFWDPAFLVNNWQNLWCVAVGHNMRLTWTCSWTYLGVVCSSSLKSCVLETLDQILLFKGNFNSVQLLRTSSPRLLVTTWDRLHCIQGQAGCICIWAPQNALAMSRLTTSSCHSPVF